MSTFLGLRKARVYERRIIFHRLKLSKHVKSFISQKNVYFKVIETLNLRKLKKNLKKILRTHKKQFIFDCVSHLKKSTAWKHPMYDKPSKKTNKKRKVISNNWKMLHNFLLMWTQWIVRFSSPLTPLPTLENLKSPKNCYLKRKTTPKKAQTRNPSRSSVGPWQKWKRTFLSVPTVPGFLSCNIFSS